jgi:hypothetical protein
MKKLILTFLLLSGLNSFASDFEPKNYTGTKEEVRELFSTLWKSFKGWDSTHCYRRAHVLSYQMSLSGINSMKVFWFRGDKLKSSWWYHVSPMVYYQGSGVVLDRGLFPGATHLEDWLGAFSKNKKCAEVFSMDEYREKKSQEHCLYMIVPMYYYGPSQLENLNLNQFEQEDLDDMLISIFPLDRGRYLRNYPLP